MRERARRRLVHLRRRRRDPRYLKTLGRLVAEGLLTTNEEVHAHKRPLRVEEVLWAGEVEPRFLELLPAMLVKRPSMFVNAEDLPEDLARVVRRLRRNLEPETFRGIPGPDVYRWLSKVGRKNQLPSRLMAFRLRPEDLRLLAQLSHELEVTQTEVIRRGLRALL